MLPKNVMSKSTISPAAYIGLLTLFAFFVSPVFAQSSTAMGNTTGANSAQNIANQITSLTPEAILANIQTAVPSLMRMVTALAYVMGMYLVIDGIVKLKHVGEARTQMSQEHHIGGPVIKIAIGALLIYLPSSVQVGMSTFWTNPNPYGYVPQQDQWAQFMNVCFLVIQFIGTIAFIRGLLILSHVGGGHGQQDAFSRGVTHVIGGIFCINIYQFIQVILMTIGVQT
jgi:hypothetical protein